MTKKEFEELPWLLWERHVIQATGYANATLDKMVDCGVLTKVQRPGMRQGRFLKLQVAKLVGLPADASGFQREPLLMPEKAVHRWTGISEHVLQQMVEAKALHLVRPAGSRYGKYRKSEVAELIGLTMV